VGVGTELWPSPSVGLSVYVSVCPEPVNCGKRLIGSGLRLGWWVGSIEVWVY